MRILPCNVFLPLFAIALLAPAPTVRSQAIFNLSGGNSRTDGGKVVGVTLNSFGQTISALGMYDSGDGLATSYTLGLWDASQTLVASAVVGPGSPLVGDFRYANITPVTIGTFAVPQPFTIGVLLPASMPDVWLDQALLTLGSGYSGAGTGQYTISGSLVFPSTIDTGNSYYVVNAGPAVVPEPGSLSLLAAGVSLLVIRQRRRR